MKTGEYLRTSLNSHPLFAFIKRFLHLYIRFSFLPLLIIFYSAAVAQSPVQDSIYRDSLNKAYFSQVKENVAATGLDTTHFQNTEGEVMVQADTTHAQTDSAAIARRLARHSPKKAGWFSAALPGLGQAYNKKFWKIPIIYAGFAGIGYAIYFTGSNFYGYRSAYRAQVATVPDVYASYNGVTDPTTLKAYLDYYKSDYDLSIIIAAAWYGLNIIDAVVDAHLFAWNMKNDISVSWRPGAALDNSVAYNANMLGLTVRVGF